jgi:hypothetical protein
MEFGGPMEYDKMATEQLLAERERLLADKQDPLRHEQLKELERELRKCGPVRKPLQDVLY